MFSRQCFDSLEVQRIQKLLPVDATVDWVGSMTAFEDLGSRFFEREIYGSLHTETVHSAMRRGEIFQYWKYHPVETEKEEDFTLKEEIPNSHAIAIW